jgi:hypothetical protein
MLLPTCIVQVSPLVSYAGEGLERLVEGREISDAYDLDLQVGQRVAYHQTRFFLQSTARVSTGVNMDTCVAGVYIIVVVHACAPWCSASYETSHMCAAFSCTSPPAGLRTPSCRPGGRAWWSTAGAFCCCLGAAGCSQGGAGVSC